MEWTWNAQRRVCVLHATTRAVWVGVVVVVVVSGCMSWWVTCECYSKSSIAVLKLFECHHHVEGEYLRDSIVVSISACHVEDPGSIPGRGASLFWAAAFLPPPSLAAQ